MTTAREHRGAERHHPEYRQFWGDARWASDPILPEDDVAWVYEIAIAHRRRPRASFVVYVGCTTNVKSIEIKRSLVTPIGNVSFVRAVSVHADGLGSSIRRAAIFVGMCKSVFDYACADGKKAIVLPTFFGSKLHRVEYS